MIITIDGPVASGKSSVAKEIAKKLNIYYLNTGLLYRATAYILKQKLREDIISGPINADLLDFIPQIEYSYLNDKAEVWYEGYNITARLVLSESDQLASIISTDKSVRDSLLNLQRKIAQNHSVVADGRDCGSIVFPDAAFKFYLTANIDARAKRMMADRARNVDATTNIEEIKKQIEARDKRDKERAIAPLTVPTGAITIDNSNLTFEETVAKFLEVIGK